MIQGARLVKAEAVSNLEAEASRLLRKDFVLPAAGSLGATTGVTGVTAAAAGSPGKPAEDSSTSATSASRATARAILTATVAVTVTHLHHPFGNRKREVGRSGRSWYPHHDSKTPPSISLEHMGPDLYPALVCHSGVGGYSGSARAERQAIDRCQSVSDISGYAPTHGAHPSRRDE